MKAFNKDKAMRKLKFKQNKNAYIKRVSIVLSCVILIISIMLFTFAYYNSSIEFTLIEGKVSEPLKDANIIAIYQGDTKVDSVPAKGSGWYFDRAECTNGATASWDKDSWSLITHFNTKTKCTVYFTNVEPPKNYSIVSGNLYTVGSVVKIANEEFYVIGPEVASHVKLLSKWNLNVGSNAKGTSTNLQDEEVRGSVSSSTPGYNGGNYYGTVAFSSTNYWSDGSTLKPAYGSGFPVYVYDSNASIKTYVDNYVTYLNTQGVNVSGRLISYEEVVALGCNVNKNTGIGSCQSAPEWVYQTSYLTGSARDYERLWYVCSNREFSHYSNYDDDVFYGVRPVIILEI